MTKVIDNTISYRVWTKDEILASFDKYTGAGRADKFSFLRVIEVIYNRQTSAEKSGKHTSEENGRGFSRYDADFLTDIYQKGCRFGGLTERQLAAAKKAMRKYAGQLAEAATDKGRLAWEAARAEEAQAEDEAFGRNPALVAKFEAAYEARMEIATNADEPGEFEPTCKVCTGALGPCDRDGLCSRKCRMKAAGAEVCEVCGNSCDTVICHDCRADEYEGPDAEDLALSRAYNYTV